MEIFPIKKLHTIIAFDIYDFHPSITGELLDKALDFAFHYIEIPTDERIIIKHTKKTTLYNNNMPRRKIGSDFDVTMGSFDGAETCELVGLFLLSQLTHYLPAQKTQAGRSNQKKKCAKSANTIACKSPLKPNKKVVDFLDITLDLRTAIHRPFKKPNSNLT